MQTQGTIAAPVPTRPWEIGAAALATLLSLGVAFMESTRPENLPPTAITFFALLALIFSAALLSHRSAFSALLATFLPALPLAAAAQALAGPGAGARAFAACAVGFQGRCLLLLAASSLRRRREGMARDLRGRLPQKAVVFVDNDIESEVELARLEAGHVFRVAPGQTIPADGMITFGSGFVDETFTARGNLVLKGMGSQVLAGTVNKNGNLLVRACATGADTFLLRLAYRFARGSERGAGQLLALDGVFCLLAATGLAFSGLEAATLAFLVSGGASLHAVLSAFELVVSRASLAKLWLWNQGGLARLGEAGMVVLRAEGVLSEGRPRLVATEVCGRLSEDAALGLLAPLARKLEGPAAFAVLHELRARNIPLQQAELFQLHENGASAIVGQDEVRWIDLSRQLRPLELGTLASFIQEHLAAGEEVHLMEREGVIEAAFALRDTPVPGAASAVDSLRASGLPVLLVSTLPRRVISRLASELGLEHAQGESSDADTELLVSRLRDEGLAPAWVQTSSFRPLRAAAIAALPVHGLGADLSCPDLQLPRLAAALCFARRASRSLRSALLVLFGCQAGLLLTVLGADAHFTSKLGLGSGWPLSASLLALLSLAPGFVAVLWVQLGLTAAANSDSV